jgi:hypothetical protein
MKRGTIEHPKMKRLARKLRCHHLMAVGIMEAIWHWTAKYAPAGDIGKHSDDDIADGIGYDDDPATLIDALAYSGWLDRDQRYRLVVHDWDQHADDAVKKAADRNKIQLISDVVPPLSRLVANCRDTVSQSAGQKKTWPSEQENTTFEDSGEEWPQEADHGAETALDAPFSQEKPHVETSPDTVETSPDKNCLPEPSLAKPEPSFCGETKAVETSPEDAGTEFTFTVTGTPDTPNWTMPRSLYDTLAKCYPAIELEDELRKAVAWCVTNSKERKTARGMPRFLNAWLARAQNRRRDPIQPVTRHVPPAARVATKEDARNWTP